MERKILPPEKTKQKISLALIRAYITKDARIIARTALPPHSMVVVTLLHRLCVERLAFTAVFVCLLAVAIWQGCVNHSLQQQLEHPDSYIVPSNITDIMRIRANSIADRLVYDFAETIVHDLANTNYEDVATRYRELSRWMHPQLKARFLREMRGNIELWRLRKIDQVFAFDKVEKFTRRTAKIYGGDKSVYRVAIWGTTRKYVEGRAVEPYRECITLSFTTAAVTSDKAWVFQLLDIKRKTQQQLDDLKNFSASKEG